MTAHSQLLNGCINMSRQRSFGWRQIAHAASASNCGHFIFAEMVPNKDSVSLTWIAAAVRG